MSLYNMSTDSEPCQGPRKRLVLNMSILIILFLTLLSIRLPRGRCRTPTARQTPIARFDSSLNNKNDIPLSDEVVASHCTQHRQSTFLGNRHRRFHKESSLCAAIVHCWLFASRAWVSHRCLRSERNRLNNTSLENLSRSSCLLVCRGLEFCRQLFQRLL